MYQKSCLKKQPNFLTLQILRDVETGRGAMGAASRKSPYVSDASFSPANPEAATQLLRFYFQLLI